MTNNSAFSNRSRDVVGRFLQSAVIVDDQAHLGEEKPPQKITSPSRGRRTPVKTGAEQSSSQHHVARHDLDARKLINTFAELGVVCAVLKPVLGSAKTSAAEHDDTFESLKARTDEATKRADIVILDWNIPEEDRPGENAKLLIRDILDTDKPAGETTRTDDHSRRLRLIAIYTGDEDLKKIKEEMAILLGSVGLGELEKSEYRVTAGPVTIVVYGKGLPTIVAGDASRRLTEEELPDRLRDDFMEMTQGLLSNAALAALSAIRTNTHRVLSRFNPRVDASYVAHRAMMQPPEEAAEHPVPLIASEIEGVLAEDARIPELVGLEAIREWLDFIKIEDQALQAHVGMSPGAFRSALLSLLTVGLGKSEEGADYPRWRQLLDRLRSYDRGAAGEITKILAPSGVDGGDLDMEFARLTSLRSQYDAPPPVLKAGTIVAEGDGGQMRYWLCVQPLCDSVRIKDARSFPFLKLVEKDAGSIEPFDFVVSDQGEYKRLRFSRKAFDMVLTKMKPKRDTKTVRADRVGSDWLFEASGNKKLRWIADLKTEHAYRVMDEFTNEIKRVGLTESEWLRRMAVKTQFSEGIARSPETGASGITELAGGGPPATEG